jgi:hypothetical protein
MASATAFLAAQLLDIAVFDRLRHGTWWRAPLAADLAASMLDTALFFTIAFSAGLVFLAPSVDVAWANEALPIFGVGPVAPLWVSLALADLGVKLGMAPSRCFRSGSSPAGRPGAVSRLRRYKPLEISVADVTIGDRMQQTRGGDPMSNGTLERAVGLTCGGTA